MTECETDETGNTFDKYLQFGMVFPGRHDIQHNDIQHNDTQHNGLICDT